MERFVADVPSNATGRMGMIESGGGWNTNNVQNAAQHIRQRQAAFNRQFANIKSGRG